MLKTVSSITNAIGALNYKGTWNASTNTPSLASGVGAKGDYYVVSVAGTTTLDGISNWGVGDWATFNGSVWQRVEGGANLNGVDLSVSGVATFGGEMSSQVIASGSVNINTTTYSQVVQMSTLEPNTLYQYYVTIAATDAYQAIGFLNYSSSASVLIPLSTGGTAFSANSGVADVRINAGYLEYQQKSGGTQSMTFSVRRLFKGR